MFFTGRAVIGIFLSKDPSLIYHTFQDLCPVFLNKKVYEYVTCEGLLGLKWALWEWSANIMEMDTFCRRKNME